MKRRCCRRGGSDTTFTIGEIIHLLGALRSRSTRSRRCWAENHQELPAAVREALKIWLFLVSTSGAHATPEGPNGPVWCALSARVTRGSRCWLARRFGLSRVHSLIGALWRVLGEQCSSEMRMPWACTVRDPFVGSGWAARALWTRWRACTRALERSSRPATTMHRCVHFVRASRGQISGALWT